MTNKNEIKVELQEVKKTRGRPKSIERTRFNTTIKPDVLEGMREIAELNEVNVNDVIEEMFMTYAYRKARKYKY